MKPCQICHFHQPSEIKGHDGYCLFWAWEVAQDRDSASKTRKACLEEGQKCLPRGSSDPHISKLHPDIDALALADRGHRLIDYHKLAKKASRSEVIAWTGIAVATLSLISDLAGH